MSVLHTKFLVHWTGHDFHKPECRRETLTDDLRQEYINRLMETLDNGFYLKKDESEKETIHDAEGGWIRRNISRVCFTEVKLTQVCQHAEKYGLLGIGVDREFVLMRCGNPVFYVYNGKYSNVVANARKVLDYLEQKNGDYLKETNQDEIMPELLEFRTLLGYFKNMNEKKDAEDLEDYDELEWRITHLARLEKENLLKVQNKKEYIYRAKFEPGDAKVIIFPDEKTKRMAFNKDGFKKWICSAICLTLDDCEHF